MPGPRPRVEQGVETAVRRVLQNELFRVDEPARFIEQALHVLEKQLDEAEYRGGILTGQQQELAGEIVGFLTVTGVGQEQIREIITTLCPCLSQRVGAT